MVEVFFLITGWKSYGWGRKAAEAWQSRRSSDLALALTVNECLRRNNPFKQRIQHKSIREADIFPSKKKKVMKLNFRVECLFKNSMYAKRSSSTSQTAHGWRSNIYQRLVAWYLKICSGLNLLIDTPTAVLWFPALSPALLWFVYIQSEWYFYTKYCHETQNCPASKCSC